MKDVVHTPLINYCHMVQRCLLNTSYSVFSLLLLLVPSHCHLVPVIISWEREGMIHLHHLKLSLMKITLQKAAMMSDADRSDYDCSNEFG